MENLLGIREITTKRLILRRFYSQNLTCVCRDVIQDSSVAKLFYGDEYVSTSNIDSYFDGLQNLYSNPYFFLWAIHLCDEERIIGFIRADYTKTLIAQSFHLPLNRPDEIMDI